MGLQMLLIYLMNNQGLLSTFSGSFFTVGLILFVTNLVLQSLHISQLHVRQPLPAFPRVPLHTLHEFLAGELVRKCDFGHRIPFSLIIQFLQRS